MPTLEEIAETIEERQETTDPETSETKFKLLKKNIKEEHGLEWEEVKTWHYVGGFKHPEREDEEEPCKRTIKLENLFRAYYPKTGDRWLANLKVMEARHKCYCKTGVYWNYIIVKDLNVFKVMPHIYHSKQRPRDFLIVGCECIKRFLHISLSKTCLNCKATHRNRVAYCNDCRTDGKWEIYCCDYCKKRGQVKLALNFEKKRKCNSCQEKWFKYCEYCKVHTETKCKINKKNGKRRCDSCYQRHLEYALSKANERDYGYSHLSYQ